MRSKGKYPISPGPSRPLSDELLPAHHPVHGDQVGRDLPSHVGQVDHVAPAHGDLLDQTGALQIVDLPRHGRVVGDIAVDVYLAAPVVLRQV